MGEPDLSAVRRRLGSMGVWLISASRMPAAEESRAANAIEQLGYTTLWFGETPTSKEAFTHAATLLARTDRLNVATGIANVHGRDAVAAANGARTLADAWPHRFVLGLGVSHAPMVADRGHEYARPVATMRAYLDAMDRTSFDPPPSEPAPLLLGALRRTMLELAGTRAQGALTYFVTPEHTRRAREILGPKPILAVEQAIVLDTDAGSARTAAREYASTYLRLPNYQASLRELGFTDSDAENGGSDALIDAVVPWGDTDTIAGRARAHLDAGADHVCVQPVAATLDDQIEHLRRLAPELTI